MSVCRRSAELMLHIWVIRNAWNVFVMNKRTLRLNYRLRQIAADNGERRVMFKPMVRTFTRAEQALEGSVTHHLPFSELVLLLLRNQHVPVYL